MTQRHHVRHSRKVLGAALLVASGMLGGAALAATGAANDGTGGSGAGAIAPKGPDSTDTRPGGKDDTAGNRMGSGPGMGEAAGRHAQPGSAQQGTGSTPGASTHATSPGTGASGSNSGNAQNTDVPKGSTTR